MREKWFFFFLLVSGCLWGSSEIGKVTILEGTATVSQVMQAVRILSVGSMIYVKDMIQTGNDSHVQIEFIDKSVLDLKENTRFSIADYSYGSVFAKDQSHSELLEGGFRLLSGAIKPDPNKYNIKTPNATIGLLGTLLEAQMSDETLYVSCSKGRVQIQNAGGTVVIGEGMSQYAVVTAYSRRPNLFINPPTNFIRPTIRPRG